MITAILSSTDNLDLKRHFEQHIPQLKRLILRVNTLCTYIANAEKKELKDFLDGNLNLSTLLFKLKTTVRSSRGHLYDNCNAIEIAVKTGDRGRKGCELYLVSDQEQMNTTPKQLFLHSDNNINTPFRYIVNDVEHRIECGEGVNQLHPTHFTVLKAMFRDGLMNKFLYLSTENLTDAELNAYSAVLKITKYRDHTKFVKEDGIIEFLKNHYFKNNEAEFAVLCRVSTVTFNQAMIRRRLDKKALTIVFKAIAESTCNEACATAMVDFKEYLKERLRSPVTRYFTDLDFFLTALAMEDEHVKSVAQFGSYYGYKSDLVFDEVIGPIENMLSVYTQMFIAQGMFYQARKGEAFHRSLVIRSTDISIADFLSDSGYVNDMGEHHKGNFKSQTDPDKPPRRINVGRNITHFFQEKTGRVRRYPDRHETKHEEQANSRRCCVIM